MNRASHMQTLMAAFLTLVMTVGTTVAPAMTWEDPPLATLALAVRGIQTLKDSAWVCLPSTIEC